VGGGREREREGWERERGGGLRVGRWVREKGGRERERGVGDIYIYIGNEGRDRER
jgi:hypothetical protein